MMVYLLQSLLMRHQQNLGRLRWLLPLPTTAQEPLARYAGEESKLGLAEDQPKCLLFVFE